MPRTRKPKKMIIGPVRARPIRGPHKDGSGRWYWRAEVWVGRGKNGQTVWIGWGHRRDVMAAVSNALVAMGPIEAAQRPLRADQILTVRDLLEHWIAAILARAAAGSLAHTTADSYRVCAQRVARSMGDVALDRLDLATLEQYRDERLRSGSAAASVDLDVRVLRVAWKWAQDRAIGPTRALPRFRVKGETTRNNRTPTHSELMRVLHHLEGWPLIATRLLAATGARIGEVANLKWEAVDLEREEVTLDGKTGRRLIPLHPEVVELLQTWRARPGSDQVRVLGVAPTTVSCSLRATYLPTACATAGVALFTPHALRRYAVDTLIREGIDVGTAAAMLGHSPEVMLRAYRKATMGDMRDALRKTRLGQSPRGQVVAFRGA